MVLRLAPFLLLAGWGPICPGNDHPPQPTQLSECLVDEEPDGGDQCPGGDNEPNDTIPNAQDAPVAACDRIPVKGKIGGQDIDIFHFTGFICDQAPSPQLHHDASEFEECLFLQCATGSTSLQSCGNDGIARRLPNGLIGCCSEKEGDINVPVQCSNTTGEIQGYVVVHGRGFPCASYQVEYHL